MDDAAIRKRLEDGEEILITFAGKEPRTMEQLTDDEREAVLLWLYGLLDDMPPPFAEEA